MTTVLEKALILKHVEHEGPGLIEVLCRDRGLEIEIVPLYAGARVPVEAPADALLVVMGGPMGVADISQEAYPFLQAEVELLRGSVKRDHPTLGICLGAQLVAFAAGARVFPNPGGSEIGVGSIRLHRTSALDLLERLPDELVMVHWHGDTFDLPPGAHGWASTPACENQAFLLHDRVIGLQFHPEVSACMIDEWLEADRDYVVGALGPGAVERVSAEARAQESRYATDGRRLLEVLLDRLASAPVN